MALSEKLQAAGVTVQHRFEPGDLGYLIHIHGIQNLRDYGFNEIHEAYCARIATDFTLSGGAAWNHSELVKEASFLWADGTAIDFTTLQTSACQRLANPAGTLGSPLAGAPDLPEHYHIVTVELSSDGGQTRVALSQDNNPTDQAREHAERNWGVVHSSRRASVSAANRWTSGTRAPCGN